MLSLCRCPDVPATPLHSSHHASSSPTQPLPAPCPVQRCWLQHARPHRPVRLPEDPQGSAPVHALSSRLRTWDASCLWVQTHQSGHIMHCCFHAFCPNRRCPCLQCMPPPPVKLLVPPKMCFFHYEHALHPLPHAIIKCLAHRNCITQCTRSHAHPIPFVRIPSILTHELAAPALPHASYPLRIYTSVDEFSCCSNCPRLDTKRLVHLSSHCLVRCRRNAWCTGTIHFHVTVQLPKRQWKQVGRNGAGRGLPPILAGLRASRGRGLKFTPNLDCVQNVPHLHLGQALVRAGSEIWQRNATQQPGRWVRRLTDRSRIIEPAAEHCRMWRIISSLPWRLTTSQKTGPCWRGVVGGQVVGG